MSGGGAQWQLEQEISEAVRMDSSLSAAKPRQSRKVLETSSLNCSAGGCGRLSLSQVWYWCGFINCSSVSTGLDAGCTRSYLIMF